jgi:hypothetical protein
MMLARCGRSYPEPSAPASVNAAHHLMRFVHGQDELASYHNCSILCDVTFTVRTPRYCALRAEHLKITAGTSGPRCGQFVPQGITFLEILAAIKGNNDVYCAGR